MAEIYSDLPSPEIDELTDEARTILEGGPIFGLRSTLHPYQRTSVATMLLKESPSQSILDPAYIQVRGAVPGGEVFYLQPTTLEVLQCCPRTSTVRGGILCEELGATRSPFSPSLYTYLTRYWENCDDFVTHIVDDRPAPRSSRNLRGYNAHVDANCIQALPLRTIQRSSQINHTQQTMEE